MVLAAMAPGSVFRLLRVEGLPKQGEPLELDSVLVCLDTLASCLAFVGATLSSTAVLDILTSSVQRFDAQPVFGTLIISVRRQHCQARPMLS